MKTPEELAKEFAERNRYSIETKQEDIEDIFLNGYEAAIKQTNSLKTSNGCISVKDNLPKFDAINSIWDRKWLGIAQPVLADVYVMAIQFDIAIDGRSWKSMNTDEKIATYREKLNIAMTGLDQAIENAVKEYEQYKLNLED